MSATTVFLCGGGAGGATTQVSCDANGCSASTSYATRAQYAAAGHAGWKRVGPIGPAAKHTCPEHTGASVPA